MGLGGPGYPLVEVGGPGRPLMEVGGPGYPLVEVGGPGHPLVELGRPGHPLGGGWGGLVIHWWRWGDLVIHWWRWGDLVIHWGGEGGAGHPLYKTLYTIKFQNKNAYVSQNVALAECPQFLQRIQLTRLR